MKTTIYLLLNLLLFATLAHADEPLTLNEALSIARRNHPLAAEAEAAVQGADARAGQAVSAYYPQINLTADWSKGDSYLTALGGIKGIQVHSTTANIKQTIYDFGRTAGAVESARRNLDAAEQARTTTWLDISFRVKSAFYLLLAAEKQVEAARTTATSREALFHQAKEFFTQGIRSKVDVARAEASLYAARSSLIQAESNRDIARIELAAAMGMASLDKRQIATPPAQMSAQLDPAQLRLQAQTERSELKRLTALNKAAEGNMKSVRSGWFPTLTATAAYGLADRGFPPDGTVWNVGINLNFPLFSGFATVEQEREAAAALSGIKAQQDNLRLIIGKEVESFWLGVQEATARVESTAKEETAAKESRALATERYREGVGSMIEATDSQAQALNAETAHIQAVYDQYISLARLDRALGKE